MIPNFRISILIFFFTIQIKVLGIVQQRDTTSVQEAKLDAYFNASKDFKNSLKFDSANLYIQQGIILAQKLKSYSKLAKFYDLLGAIWEKYGESSKALENEMLALKIYQKLNDAKSIARIKNNIGVTYFNFNDYKNAVANYNEANALLDEKDERLKTIVELNIGESYLKLHIPDSAVFYETASLNHNNNAFPDLKAYALGILGQVYFEKNDFSKSKSNINQALSIFREVGDGYALSEYLYHLGKVYAAEAKNDSALYFLGQSVDTAKSIKAKLWQKEAYREMAAILKLQKHYEKALEYTNLSNIIKDSIFNENTSNRITQLNALYETEKKEAQIALLKQKDLVHEKEIERQKQIRYIITFAVFIISIFAIILFNINMKKQKAYRILARQNVEITHQKEEILDQAVKLELHSKRLEAEKNKSDRLLRNILPEEIVTELKEKGEAKPRLYHQATMLFADFVNFTCFAENNSPQEITRKLDSFFLNFDMICDKHNLEKIKTIGDCYMAAGGLPIPNTTNAHDAIKAAIEINNLVKGTGWHIRIGIHTGPVVAGVIGINKFAYDVWGDAVNLAARLESTSENDRINISKETYLLVKDEFRCTSRGFIFAKNKGKIEMYFVDIA